MRRFQGSLIATYDIAVACIRMSDKEQMEVLLLNDSVGALYGIDNLWTDSPTASLPFNKWT